MMRVLTTSDNILYVGVNLDHPSPISSIEVQQRDQKVTPLFDDILLFIDKLHTGTADQKGILKAKAEKQIQSNIKRIYYTFPGTGEKGNNHYFSRFLLGQSLLLDKALGTNFEKYVFIYSENIPTEAYSQVESRSGLERTVKKPVESAKFDQSHGVVTIVFIPKNAKNLVYVMNVVETDGRPEVFKKGIPLGQLSKAIKEKQIVELNISFDIRRNLNFKKYFSMEINEPTFLEVYSKNTNKFQGSFVKVFYPAGLKETFDEVLKSQLASPQGQFSLLGKYKELFEKLGEAILPFKDLIENEEHTQAVLHGAFSHYSDIKLGESENRVLVLTEFQTGRGKRIDMLVHGIKFADQHNDAKECDPVGIEIKGPRKGKDH